MTDSADRQPDFFISYTHVDEAWATWVAWTLEQAGYTTVLQAWDFRPGSNFVLEMQRAAEQAERTIAILTPAYFESTFAKPEWAAAFASDPEGLKRQLVPVQVENVDVEGLWGQIVHINLVGLETLAAEKKLLAGLEPGRAKPLTAPPFPGANADAVGTKVHTPPVPAAELRWEVLRDTPRVVWRSEALRAGQQSGPTVLELHLVSVPAARIEIRRLRSLPEELGEVGRQRGLFTSTQALTPGSTEELAYVFSAWSRSTDESGLLISRNGQRGAWITLPHDGLGSVLDPADAQPRVAALLELLVALPLENPQTVGIAVGVDPTMLLTVGSASAVGNRSSATMSHAGRQFDPVLPDDVVSFSSLRANINAVAEEVVARLLARLSLS